MAIAKKRPNPRTKAKAEGNRLKARTATVPPTSKLNQLVAALQSKRGASISDLMEVTGWLAHSVRGAISGALRKKRGLAIVSERVGGERLYRIASAA